MGDRDHVWQEKEHHQSAGAAHDHLFLESHRGSPQFGGSYPPATYLQLCFTCNMPPDRVYPDERGHDPQHACYQAMMYDILGIEKLPTGMLRFTFSFEQRRREMQAAFITAYEPFSVFEHELAIWAGRPLRQKLIDARRALVEQLIPYRAQTPRRTKTVESIKACWNAPIDITGETTLDFVKQMSPDDWHEIAMTWNWDQGVEVLEWITSQPDCDRATAVYILCHANLEQVAEYSIERSTQDEFWAFAWDLAQRIRAGFFTKTDLHFGVSLRTHDALKATLARAHATGREPWLLPEELLANGPRRHKPRYTSLDPRIAWHYDYWLEHIASAA